MKKIKFYECEKCAAEPGSPPLCTACWQRRDIVEAINELTALQGEGEKCGVLSAPSSKGLSNVCQNPKGQCPIHEKRPLKEGDYCDKYFVDSRSPQPVSTEWEERFDKAWQDGETFYLRELAKSFISKVVAQVREEEKARVRQWVSKNKKYMSEMIYAKDLLQELK